MKTLCLWSRGWVWSVTCLADGLECFLTPLLLLLFQRWGINFLAPASWMEPAPAFWGSPPEAAGDALYSWCLYSGWNLGSCFVSERWPKLFWLGFVMNLGDRLCLLTGLKSIRASSFQCTASVLEQPAFFSFKLSFVLNHEFQLKLGKF